jgi:hypothetical protein
MIRSIFGAMVVWLSFTGLGQTLPDTAQSCEEMCSCATDLAPAGIMMSTVHAKNQWMLSYRYMYMGMGAMQSGTEAISNETVYNQYLMTSNKMQMHMHMLMGMYGLCSKLTLMAMLHYQASAMHMEMFAAGSHNHGTQANPSDLQGARGLGDLKLSAMYEVLNLKQNRLYVALGVGLPTGSTNIKGAENSMYPNKILPYNMQTGSGSVEIQPSLGYVYTINDWNFGTQIHANIRTGYNKVGYKLGNELAATTWAAYQWAYNFSSSVRLGYATLGAIQGANSTVYTWSEPATNPQNYGGTQVQAYIGSNYFIRAGLLKNQKIGLEYGLPLYQNLNGIQMRAKSALNVSWSMAF